MNIATENTTNHNSIFDTKEQYLAFRAKWNKSYAGGFHKKTKHEYHHGGHYEKIPGTNSGYKYIEGVKGFYTVSPLTVFHHLIFNLAIGRNPSTHAFSNYRKSESVWSRPNLYWKIKYSNWDFSPFGDTLTAEQIERLKQQAEAYILTL